MAPRGVLWDVGNVIVGWNPRRLYSKIFPDPAACEDFLARVCTPAWHTEHDRGVSFADNRRALTARFPRFAAEIAAWDERFLEMVGPPIAETEAVIEDLARRGVPMFGLTNMPAVKWPAIRALTPAFERLSDVVVSGEVGLVKPDPAIFAAACARAGMAPGELLFVDDHAPNVEAARALGFAVHHMTDPRDLRPAVQAAGLL